MILTPIAPDILAAILARYRAALPADGVEIAVFDRIAASGAVLGGQPDRWHRDAVALAHGFGMNPIDEPPQKAFSWDGQAVRTGSEPAVILHEVAHFQLASPARRVLPDFGLGAGPETGFAALADAACRLTGPAREIEEQMASLLGILWEIDLNQPGILAFQEQNWLEGAGRPGAAAHFTATLQRLLAWGLIDPAGHPLSSLRITDDPMPGAF